jgi:hypothetical protein
MAAFSVWQCVEYNMYVWSTWHIHVDVIIRWEYTHTGVHIYFACRHHCIGDLFCKWRSVKLKSASDFMTGLKNVWNCCQMGTTPFKWGMIVDVLWDTLCESGMVWLQWVYHIKLQVVNMRKSLWTETQMTVLQMVSSTFTTKPQGLTEFNNHEAYDHFGIWHPKCFSAKG